MKKYNVYLRGETFSVTADGLSMADNMLSFVDGDFLNEKTVAVFKEWDAWEIENEPEPKESPSTGDSDTQV